MDPETAAYNKMFAELIVLETYRSDLCARSRSARSHERVSRLRRDPDRTYGVAPGSGCWRTRRTPSGGQTSSGHAVRSC